MSLRKITENRRAFPSEQALLKLFYLALNNIAKKWTMPVQNWKPVLNRLQPAWRKDASQLTLTPFTQNLDPSDVDKHYIDCYLLGGTVILCHISQSNGM